MTTVRAAKSKGSRWSPEDIDYLIDNYGVIKTEVLAEKLGRSVSSIHTKANRMSCRLPSDYFKRFPVKSSDKGYISKGYRRKSREGKKVQEHILVWEKHNGKVPKGMHIHHCNGNKLDNRIENLICVTPQQHAYLHRKYDYDAVKRLYASGKYTMYDLAVKLNTTTSQICYMVNHDGN